MNIRIILYIELKRSYKWKLNLEYELSTKTQQLEELRSIIEKYVKLFENHSLQVRMRGYGKILRPTYPSYTEHMCGDWELNKKRAKLRRQLHETDRMIEAANDRIINYKQMTIEFNLDAGIEL